MGEWFIVVVVFGDLLQVEPLVPALLLPHQPRYLLFQFVQCGHVILRSTATDLTGGILAVTDVSHYEVLTHLMLYRFVRTSVVAH